MAFTSVWSLTAQRKYSPPPPLSSISNIGSSLANCRTSLFSHGLPSTNCTTPPISSLISRRCLFSMATQPGTSSPSPTKPTHNFLKTFKRTYAKKKKKETPTNLSAVLKQIEDQYGAGAIQTLESPTAQPTVEEVIPTGSLGLDLALGIGGLPKRRIVEIYGPEASGKTSIALSVIAQAQKKGGTCAFVDVEHSLNPQWAKTLGVNTTELLFTQPNSAEEALEITNTLVSSGQLSVVVIDSVAALVPSSELEGHMGDAQIGVQARLMSHALRKLTGVISKSNTLVIFINQIRMKIGVMFGSPETTSGGTALKYFSSIRLDVRRSGFIKAGEEVIGSTIRVKVTKNKVAPPYKQAEFDVFFTRGLSKEGELVDIATREGVIKKSGNWYLFPNGANDPNPVKIGLGRDKARSFLEKDVETAKTIEALVRQRWANQMARGGSVPPTEEEEESAEDKSDVEERMQEE